MRKSHQDRVAVLTGASGGLGGHFARRLAEQGCYLALAYLLLAHRVALRVLSGKCLKVEKYTCP